MTIGKGSSISYLLFRAALGLLCLGTWVDAQSVGFQNPNINSQVHAVALQEDGKIVIGGLFTSVGGQPRGLLARLNNDGPLDTGFQNPNLAGQGVFVVAVQPDGKVLAGGDFRISGQPDTLYLARFNPDGTRDTTFNAVMNGIVWTVVPQPDGTILIGGAFSTVSGQARTKMARLNSDGSVDATFPDTGIISTLGIPAVVYAIAPQSDGKIIVGGYFDMAGGQVRTAIIRLNSDSTLDATFQDPGAAGGTGTTINHQGNQTIVNSLAIQADGKIMIGGAFNTVSGQTRNNLARLNADGSIDTSFQNPAITNFPNAFAKSIALQPDGRVLVAGFFDTVGGQARGRLARLNADGTLDGTFVDTMVNGLIYRVVLQPDGRVIIGGAFSSVLGSPRPALTRLTSTGALDLPSALVLTVTKTADTNDGSCDADCSLREAIAAANASESNDTIQFDPSVFSTPQTITLTNGQLAVCNNGNVVINGTGADRLVISGNNQSRIFRFFPGTAATLNGLTIADGNTPIGTFTGCPVVGIDASFGGGGIENRGTLVINNSVIRNNLVTGAGGGISNAYGTITINNSSIRNNRASSNFGGIANVGFGTPLLVTATIINSRIMNNEALSATADGGGGIGNINLATLSLINSTVDHNTSAGLAGGIRNSGATLTISNSAISSNVASGGAGITNSGTGTVSLIGSTVSNNTTPGDGGGIRNLGAPITVTNSTISGNIASSGGGFHGGSLNLINATVAFNQADTCGGIYSFGGVASRNSIIANNVANSAPDFSGPLNSAGFNLIKNTSGTTIVGGPSDILGVDPMLGPLSDNGGPTLTHALLLGSPAVDKAAVATGVTTDQRGTPRPIDNPSVSNAPGGDGSDIGAFEVRLKGAPFDFDGDGKTDIGIFRPPVGEWWYQRSSDGQVPAFQFGATTDRIVPADYTGDGKTDIAFFRPSTGEWYILRSENLSFYSFPFGASEDIPVPADYDADGKADPAVFRPSSATWFIQRSSDNGTTIAQFGATGDHPVAADYDGDGRADLAIYRPSNGQWWLNRSTAGVIVHQFGDSNDKPVQGDYTGDGKSDVAFWRPSTGEWYILRSEDNSYYSAPFGTATDIPAPGDYDGDGKFDTTVFRPSNANWYSQRTTAGTLIQQFGATGDTPIPNAFVR